MLFPPWYPRFMGPNVQHINDKFIPQGVDLDKIQLRSAGNDCGAGALEFIKEDRKVRHGGALATSIQADVKSRRRAEEREKENSGEEGDSSMLLEYNP